MTNNNNWPVIAAASAAAGAALGWLSSMRIKAPGSSSSGAQDSLADRSTTSSAGGGAAAYETRKAVDEYLQFHYGADEDILPYSNGPKEALRFTARLAQLCAAHCPAASGSSGNTAALDVGCAVGGASFELARTFHDVLGIDYSHAFVEAAQDMQRSGSRQYEAVVQGNIRRTYTATLPKDIQLSRVHFAQGDACALPADLPQYDAVLAANLLCRLPDPMHFIDRLPSLVKAGGIAVLVSPYSWLAAWTPKDKWLGGKMGKDGKPLPSADAIAELMEARGFTLVHEEDVPFLIREHVRKYQWGCSHATVWKKSS